MARGFFAADADLAFFPVVPVGAGAAAVSLVAAVSAISVQTNQLTDARTLSGRASGRECPPPAGARQCREPARTANTAPASLRAAANLLVRLHRSDVGRPGRRRPTPASTPPTPSQPPKMGLPTGQVHSPTPRHRDAAKRAQTAGTARNSLGKPAENRRPRPNAAPTTPPDVPAQCPNLRLRSYSVARPAPTTWPAPHRRKPRRAAMSGVQTQLHRPSSFRRPPADSPIALRRRNAPWPRLSTLTTLFQSSPRHIHGKTNAARAPILHRDTQTRTKPNPRTHLTTHTQSTASRQANQPSTATPPSLANPNGDTHAGANGTTPVAAVDPRRNDSPDLGLAVVTSPPPGVALR